MLLTNKKMIFYLDNEFSIMLEGSCLNLISLYLSSGLSGESPNLILVWWYSAWSTGSFAILLLNLSKLKRSWLPWGLGPLSWFSSLVRSINSVNFLLFYFRGFYCLRGSADYFKYVRAWLYLSVNWVIFGTGFFF